jgi:hypothetical protein
MANAEAHEIKRLEGLSIVGRRETEGVLYLTLAGKMTANGIGELRREIEEARRQRKPVRLDLGEVTLLDRISADFLNAVSCSTIRFENSPAYLQRWIMNGKRKTGLGPGQLHNRFHVVGLRKQID